MSDKPSKLVQYFPYCRLKFDNLIAFIDDIVHNRNFQKTSFICGPPGTGKSVLASAIQQVVRRYSGRKLDVYHDVDSFIKDCTVHTGVLVCMNTTMKRHPGYDVQVLEHVLYKPEDHKDVETIVSELADDIILYTLGDDVDV